MTTDDPPGAFTRVTIERHVVLPDGSCHGLQAAYVLAATPYGADLLFALDPAVRRLDTATVDAIAEAYGPEAGFTVADEVHAAEARWRE